jgi:hypothetical protein
MLSIKTEIGRGFQANGPDLAAVERLVAPSIAGALGEAIRLRVQQRGDLAGQAWSGYDDSHRPFLTSAKYPDHATGAKHWSGAERFKDSAEYHAAAGVRRGSFSVTGGMWSGLSRVIHSPYRADIMFRGRSDGQNARILKGKSRPIKESNALKAWTVMNKAGVNILALSDAELHAVGEGVGLAAARGVSNAIAVQWQGPPPPVDVAAIFRQAFRVQREIPAGAPGA